MEKRKQKRKRPSSQPPDSSSNKKPPETKKPKPASLDIRIDQLFRSVYDQKGVRADLLLIDTGVGGILQNSVNRIKQKMRVTKGFHPNEYVLSINDEVITEGVFPSKGLAKAELSTTAVDILRKDCFYLKKKSPVYENVPLNKTYNKNDLINIQLEEQTNGESSNKRNENADDKDELDSHILEGSKAHRMMLKMGWSGKGLGNNEQGTVAPIAVEVREKWQGLGSSQTKSTKKKKEIDEHIVKILEDFINSSKTTTLSFDSGYSKEERERIHAIARRLDLKSKSTGKGDSRRITISRKVEDYHLLIGKLLRSGLEDDNYTLEIPSNFLYLFQ